MELSPGGIIAWIIVGLIAGCGTIIVAFLGALVLLFILRLFGRGRARA